MMKLPSDEVGIACARYAMMQTLPLLLAVITALAACATQTDEPEDGIDDRLPDGKADGGIEEGSPQALAILRIANTAEQQTLDHTVGLSSRAARNIAVARQSGTVFATLAELDAVPYIGPVALARLDDYAMESWPRWEALGEGTLVQVPVRETRCRGWEPVSDPENSERCEPSTDQLLGLSLQVDLETGYVYAGTTRGGCYANPPVVAHTGSFTSSCGDGYCSERSCTRRSLAVEGVLGDRLVITRLAQVSRATSYIGGSGVKYWKLGAPATIELPTP